MCLADDLPVSSPIGTQDSLEDVSNDQRTFYLYTHKTFVIEYNQDRVSLFFFLST